MDWFDFLAVQGTLKSLLQHHSSKASILWCSAFLVVQLSHPYMTPDFLDCVNRHVYFLPGGQSFLFSFTAFSMKRVGDVPEQPCFLLGDVGPAGGSEARGPHRQRGDPGPPPLFSCVSASLSLLGRGSDRLCLLRPTHSNSRSCWP